MSKKIIEPNLQDVVNWFEASAKALQACAVLVDMSNICGEVFSIRENQNMLEEAQRLAKEAIKKAKGR